MGIIRIPVGCLIGNIPKIIPAKDLLKLVNERSELI